MRVDPDTVAKRLQSLAVPLAIGVFVIASTATLFRPAFTISAAPETTIVARVSAASTGDGPPADRGPDPSAPVTSGRSVDVMSKLSLPQAEADRMFERGQAMAATGDFAAARLLLGRAADAGHADAMFALAATYDPNVLSARGARGLVGEPEQAKALYARALAAGVENARQRMAALGG